MGNFGVKLTSGGTGITTKLKSLRTGENIPLGDAESITWQISGTNPVARLTVVWPSCEVEIERKVPPEV